MKKIVFATALLLTLCGLKGVAQSALDTDFETGVIPDGWTVKVPGSGYAGGYKVVKYSDESALKATNVGTNDLGGTYCLKCMTGGIRSRMAGGDSDNWLTSPEVTIDEKDIFTFRLAANCSYSPTMEEDEYKTKMDVLVKCGEETTKLATITPENYFTWKQYSYDLSAFKGKTVNIVFHDYGSAGESAIADMKYIDNIKLTDAKCSDYIIEAVLHGQADYKPSYTVRVYNYGLAKDNFTLNYQIGEDEAVTETINEKLGSEEYIDYTFKNGPVFTPGTNVTVKTWVDEADDAFILNNKLEKDLQLSELEELPYSVKNEEDEEGITTADLVESEFSTSTSNSSKEKWYYNNGNNIKNHSWLFKQANTPTEEGIAYLYTTKAFSLPKGLVDFTATCNILTPGESIASDLYYEVYIAKYGASKMAEYATLAGKSEVMAEELAKTPVTVKLNIPEAGSYIIAIRPMTKNKSAMSITGFSVTDPATAFSAIDDNGKHIDSKFATTNFTLKYNDDITGLTFKVNDTDVTYDEENGIKVAGKVGSKKNDAYTISVYKGETLWAEKTYTYIPTFNLSTYKSLEDDTEAILAIADGNKVTYSSDTETYVEDATRGLMLYDTGLSFTAFKQLAAGYIWGKKTTLENRTALVAADSTATFSTVKQTANGVLPTTLAVKQTLLPVHQLRYAKLIGVQIVKEDGKYYAESASDQVLITDKFETGVMSQCTTDPCFADVFCIVSVNGEGTSEVLPLKLENLTDKRIGDCGSVKYSLDADGNMVFYPANGKEGTLDATGIQDSKRPWSTLVTSVKTVKFEAGVNANEDNSYMFKGMTNLESVDFTNFNTSDLTTMKGLFLECESLKSADMSKLDLTNVTNFQQTFNGCTSLESIDFGDNTLDNATNLSMAFYGCKTLKALDFSKVSASVSNIAQMLYDCTALEKVDFRELSTKGVYSEDNVKNVFGSGAYAAMPQTLVISKNFGKTAVADTYVSLPQQKYQRVENSDPEKIIKRGFDLSDANEYAANLAAMYEYNSALNDFGTYVKTDKIDDSDNPAAGIDDVDAGAEADGKFIRNGRVVIKKNGKQFTAAGQRMK